jgi:hypothetical protein
VSSKDILYYRGHGGNVTKKALFLKRKAQWPGFQVRKGLPKKEISANEFAFLVRIRE